MRAPMAAGVVKSIGVPLTGAISPVIGEDLGYATGEVADGVDRLAGEPAPEIVPAC